MLNFDNDNNKYVNYDDNDEKVTTANLSYSKPEMVDDNESIRYPGDDDVDDHDDDDDQDDDDDSDFLKLSKNNFFYKYDYNRNGFDNIDQFDYYSSSNQNSDEFDINDFDNDNNYFNDFYGSAEKTVENNLFRDDVTDDVSNGHYDDGDKINYGKFTIFKKFKR